MDDVKSNFCPDGRFTLQMHRPGRGRKGIDSTSNRTTWQGHEKSKGHSGILAELEAAATSQPEGARHVPYPSHSGRTHQHRTLCIHGHELPNTCCLSWPAHTTISRELRRNGSRSGYRARTAEYRARKRRAMPRHCRCMGRPDLAVWTDCRPHSPWRRGRNGNGCFAAVLSKGHQFPHDRGRHAPQGCRTVG